MHSEFWLHATLITTSIQKIRMLLEKVIHSLEENANAQDTRYNRVLTKEAFEDVWKTRTLLPKNIYIVVRTTSK